MKPIRPFLALACVIGLAAPAVAQSCMRPSEVSAIQLRALQSRLMVGAIACQQQDAYNVFVRRHQGELGGAYRTAEGHFRRAHGAQGQRRWNSTDTDIAAQQSLEHTRQGSFFCRDTTSFFQEVGALNSVGDLVRYSNERNIIQGYHAPDCAEEPARRPAARPARRG